MIIVAHMDGVHGTQAANDNASGVGVLLTVARYLAGKDGVLVAAIGAEERMYTGSSWHLGSRRLTSGFSAAHGPPASRPPRSAWPGSSASKAIRFGATS